MTSCAPDQGGATTGATAPQPGCVAPPARSLPRSRVPGDVPLVWVGAHGGAGTDTLAALLPGSLALPGAWPQAGAERPDAGDGPPVAVVLVARTSAACLDAAARAATQWAAGVVPGVDLLGLALVPDRPGRLPRELRRLRATVAGGVPRCWTLPWVEEWRRGAPACIGTAPAAHRRLVAELTAEVAARHRRSGSVPVAPPGPAPAQPDRERPVATPEPAGSPR